MELYNFASKVAAHSSSLGRETVFMGATRDLEQIRAQ